MTKTSRRIALTAISAAVTLAAVYFLYLRPEREDRVDQQAAIEDALSEESEASIRVTCSTCHVFPEPDILPRSYWPVAVRGMFQIAEQRGIELPVSLARATVWYLFNAPERLPAATGRTDAGPGPVMWDLEEWRPASAAPPAERGPGVTHVQVASLFGGSGLDLIVSDVSTDRIYALRPYAPELEAVVLGEASNPGRVTVTDLDHDGAQDLVVAVLGEFVPTNDPVGSVVWFRRTGPESFEKEVIADGLGRVADVRTVDLTENGRTDVLVAVFGWMENGGLLWLENTDQSDGRPTFTQHILDARPGFTDVRAEDLNGDGRLDIIALIAQEFQQVMVYWAEEDGYRPEIVFQAPNPDWGFTGLAVTDFTGDGLPDLIVTNGDNLDLTVAKPYHGVGLVENLGEGRFTYRHLTSMYGVHKPVAVDLIGDGNLGLLVSAYLPPSVIPGVPDPSEAIIWLERVGPTQLVRRVLQSEGVDYMTMAAGDVTGDGRTDFVVGLMDLGVVDPRQAHQGEPLVSFVTLWRNRGLQELRTQSRDEAEIIDWSAGEPPDSAR